MIVVIASIAGSWIDDLLGVVISVLLGCKLTAVSSLREILDPASVTGSCAVVDRLITGPVWHPWRL